MTAYCRCDEIEEMLIRENAMKNEVFEIDHSKPRRVRVWDDDRSCAQEVYPLFFVGNEIVCVSSQKENVEEYLEDRAFSYGKNSWLNWEQIPEPQERDITIDELIDQGAEWIVTDTGIYARICELEENKVIRFGDVRTCEISKLVDLGWKWTTNDDRRNLRSFKVKDK
jgi:hypothetical protein